MKVSAKAKFLATNIINGKVDYFEAISKYPELKDQIDFYLTSKGYPVPDSNESV